MQNLKNEMPNVISVLVGNKSDKSNPYFNIINSEISYE